MDHRVGHKDRRAIMRGERATDTIEDVGAPPSESDAAPGAVGPAPMDEGTADTDEACVAALSDSAPTSILTAAVAADLSEDETLQQPAIAVPHRVPRYAQPLPDNPFFLYRAPDLLRDANDPSLPPPPGLKWAYHRRQVRWYLRSAEEGPLASRPWIWALLLFASVFALAILSRLVGG
jgi:hypothetical protein